VLELRAGRAGLGAAVWRRGIGPERALHGEPTAAMAVAGGRPWGEVEEATARAEE